MNEIFMPLYVGGGFSGSRVITMEILPRLMQEWCLAMVLLKEGLIPKMIVKDLSGSFSLELTVLDKGGHRSRLTMDNASAKMMIAKNDLDSCLIFFLKSYRDDISDVDHLDIQYSTENSGKSSGYVIMKVSKYREPKSSEEMRKLLGL